MRPESVARISESYQVLAPRVNDLVGGFYSRLFAAYPQVRPLFRDDMTIQRNHFAATLALLVRNVAYQDLLEEAVMDLGGQHVGWGARLEHYPAVKEALLASIGEGLGDRWTSELESDWRELLDRVIAMMRKGAARFAVREAMSGRPDAD